MSKGDQPAKHDYAHEAHGVPPQLRHEQLLSKLLCRAALQ
jgi:hypothetical protein